MARGDATLRDLTLTGARYDRRADRRADPLLIGTLLADPRTRVLALHEGAAPMRRSRSGLEVLWRDPEPADAGRLVVFLGEAAALQGGGSVAYLAVVEQEPLAVVEQEPREAEARAVEHLGLRQVAADLNAQDAGLFATALALANWHDTHAFCPRCGSATVVTDSGWTRRCERDASVHFPRTDPAVIMSVIDAQDRLLLAQGARFGSPRMSVLAGFVEPGETFAQAVRREVCEEVGVQVGEVTYLADQPWPFPAGLMIGFTAQAISGDLRLQEDEIQCARWFSRVELRRALNEGSLELPGHLSIARRLIEHWYGAPLQTPEVPLRD